MGTIWNTIIFITMFYFMYKITGSVVLIYYAPVSSVSSVEMIVMHTLLSFETEGGYLMEYMGYV